MKILIILVATTLGGITGVVYYEALGVSGLILGSIVSYFMGRGIGYHFID